MNIVKFINSLIRLIIALESTADGVTFMSLLVLIALTWLVLNSTSVNFTSSALRLCIITMSNTIPKTLRDKMASFSLFSHV